MIFKKISVIKNRSWYYAFSGTIFVASILALITWGLKPGLDFAGGSLMEVSFTENRPTVSVVENALAPLNLGDIKVQTAGEHSVIIRFGHVSEDTHQAIKSAVIDTAGEGGEQLAREDRFESVGPAVGAELADKAWIALSVTLLAIISYIAYAFRRVSKPVASWKYGVTAVVALIHDVTLVAGLFAVLGHFYGVEVDALFITALLTVLGFSVHDTIVVFDRVRENLARHYQPDFLQVVNDSVNQTMARSINTSMTTLIALTVLYFFGGATIHNFVLALIIGIAFGTYSSIFIASTLIVDWHLFDRRRLDSKSRK